MSVTQTAKSSSDARTAWGGFAEMRMTPSSASAEAATRGDLLALTVKLLGSELDRIDGHRSTPVGTDGNLRSVRALRLCGREAARVCSGPRRTLLREVSSFFLPYQSRRGD